MKELFLFVRPPRPLWPFIGPSMSFWPPLAFASLAAALREALPDLRVAILDAPILQMGWRTLERELRRLEPAYVGLGEEAVSCIEGLRLAGLAKAVGARVIAGGCFFGHVAPQVLATGLMDIVVHGEGEITIVELVQALRGGAADDLRQVRGISYHAAGFDRWASEGPPARFHEPPQRNAGFIRQALAWVNPRPDESGVPRSLRFAVPMCATPSGVEASGVADLRSSVIPAGLPGAPPGTEGEVVFTGHRPLIADLDRLPFPAYDLLPVERYGERSRNHPRFAAIELSRGCLDACSFCVLWRQMGHFQGSRLVPRLRTKSPERLIEEVRRLARRFRRGYLGWVDPCFNADSQVPAQLAERMLRENLRFGQSAWVRADGLLRDEASGGLETCVAAGLNEVYVGIERPDTTGLEALHKREDVDQCRRAFRMLAEKHPQVFVVGSFIYGLPGDTPDTVRRIYQLSLELDLDKAFFIPLTPLPGTPFWRPQLWDATGRRFRAFSFLPHPTATSPFPELDRALLACMIREWRPSRLWGYWRGLLRSTPRKRRLTWRVFLRSTRFVLGLTRQSLFGTHSPHGMLLPRWYE